MEHVEEITTWKVKELRDWLDRETITYAKTAKKQELIELVLEAGKKGAVIERIITETEISKLTIDGLIQWLTDRNVDLPPTRHKKQYYVDMAEAISQSIQGEIPTSPPRTEKPKQPPSTTPRPSRATSRKTPSISKAKSSSPPTRRRSARRKLLDMPDLSSSSNEDDEETAETEPLQNEVVEAPTSCAPSSCRNRIGSMFMLFVIFAVISAYIAYLTKSLIPHLNW